MASSGIILRACLVVASITSAQEVPPHTSVGTPQRGRITGGETLPERGTGYHWITNRENPSAHYGTPALVGALQRAAAAVAREFAGSDLAIHDISFERGGSIRGHGSHTSGRDVDIAYYAIDPAGARVDPTISTWFAPSGIARGMDAPYAPRIDTERMLLFLSALLDDPAIRVKYVFMHPALQRILLDHAGERRAALSAVLRTPHGRDVDPHADHFHVRIHCPASDVQYGCVD